MTWLYADCRVIDAGGGEVRLLFDREAPQYPPAGVKTTLRWEQPPPPRCPFFIPYIESGYESYQQVQCEGKIGHDGPHQVRDDVWRDGR